MASAEDDDLPPLVGEDGQEVGDDDVPPLVGEDGQEAPPDSSGAPSPVPERTIPKTEEPKPEPVKRLDPMDMTAEELKATAALQVAAQLAAAEAQTDKTKEDAEPVSAADAMKGALAVADEGKPAYKAPDANTIRMVTAISKDDFEECESAILEGADVNADCGAGMRAIHISALRGEMFLTELLIAQGADVNARDMSGNTPLLYTCHFYRQHGKGCQLVSQLLYHKGDPFARIKDGKMGGQSAHDIMEKACKMPNTDENVPIQMRAMIQLAMDSEDQGREAITKMWMHFKASNKKLYTVSSKKDSYDYLMKSIAWDSPEGTSFAPKKLEDTAGNKEERFTELKSYSFSDAGGDSVKVYVQFPDHIGTALDDKEALEVNFEMEAFEVKLRTSSEKFRCRVDPLFGTIDIEKCKHRVSSGSKKITLTLVKRHTGRKWAAVQKSR